MGTRKYKSRYTAEQLKNLPVIIEEVLADYKDPTENMTLGQKREFDKAMKKVVNELQESTNTEKDK